MENKRDTNRRLTTIESSIERNHELVMAKIDELQKDRWKAYGAWAVLSAVGAMGVEFVAILIRGHA